MSELHERLKLTFAIYLQEVEELEKRGKKVSAVRARKALQEMKDIINERRKEIQDQKTEL